MKKIQLLMLLLAGALMGYSSSLRAEDTDIYVDNSTNGGVPNVLFVMDTGANFSSSAAVPCTAYATGGAPSLGNTAGGIEQCALVDTIQALPDGVVNIGILVNNNNNFGTDTRSTADAAYHETCMGTYGGCVIRKLTFMDAAGKASLVNFIKSWKTSGSNSTTEFNVKSGGDRTAGMMQEAWAYYNGKIGMSGKSYSPSILASGCQKNFVLFIGNSFNTSGTPADTGTESPYNGAYGMTHAQTGATADQKLKISETVTFNPATCSVTTLNAGTNASDWSENWGDEWARIMYQQDGGTNDMENAQNIKTYTIGVVNDASCKPDYPALLTTMAKYGGGKYFKTSNAEDLKNALQTVLNEVQAVNSVFSSASLPVSVNAEGTYLNQIYLGMFRPDATAAPRWMGNLKQYQLVKNSSGVLVMGDKNGNPAISSSGTGFISPNAVSFWTKKDTASLPDSAGGFWKNDRKGVPESGYDSPDGEVVEKGGVAQQLRLESLTADFSTTEGSTTNPRRMYTYCPAGTSCNAALTDSSNAFATTNAGIPASAFGASTTLPIVSIVRTGTTATVTTSGAHGFSSGTSVTISGAGQADYNVTQAVTVTSATTFTISGLTDFPTTPTAGTYTVSSSPVGAVSVTSMSRTTSTSGGKNTETVTVTTSGPHGFTTSSNVSVTGAGQASYNYSGTPTAVLSATSFTYDVSVEPRTPAANTYQVQLSPTTYPAMSNVSLANPAQGEVSGTTSTAHRLHVGQTVTISNVSDGNGSKYPGTFTVSAVPSATTFSLTGGPTNLKNQSGITATITPDTTAQTVSTLTRAATTDSATATVTGMPSGWFGAASGDTKIVNISKSSGSSTNESAYVASNATITCVNSGCTSFTYTITVTPAATATGSIVAGLTGASSASLAAGAITRSGATATVTGVTAGTFTNGQTVYINASGSALSSESAYVGQWTISCTSPCSTFTFGPVTQSPATPATGSNMIAYSGSTPPDKNTLIRWIRGEDNFGDEKGPGGTVTARPSVHGDVLHSRPLVVNYGDSRGMVVFYGANDGVYHAVNGNQTGNIGSVPAGGELWSLVLPEHYGQFNRLRLNSPELKFPTTTLASAQPKNYFVDGPTAAYQKIAADGTIDRAYIYLTMRRGGRFIYAIDVSNPASPTVMWRISSGTSGFEELGQTWSRPRLAMVEGGGLNTTPVLIFGGGYDAAEDSEPPTADTMGRGIFVVNALTGALIWQANSTCTTSATCRNTSGMNYAIPSDVAFVDRNGDGYTDKLYVGDLGGNIWRVDIKAASTADWTVTKLAALGCASGACSSGSTPRKFFFPPAVLSVGKSGVTGSFDAISLPSGDREHPLKSAASGSSYFVNDKFFMVMDTGTTITPVTNNVNLTNLFNATSTAYDGTVSGFYINFTTGEKGVNAPLATNGQIFFATNRPMDRAATCAANLGEARGYAVSPFLGTKTSSLIDGGGLPPGAVTGLVEYTDPVTGKKEEERICIGCVANCTGSGCSALENNPPPPPAASNLRRTYWYRK
ncbi:hypothetical protein GCM10027034_10580 [Ramlibacter solisilvae]|uniref:PilC/PilY family type IV pilus protein n=1 Tax=Ramlibacter tataouinensis TaxID=94132 RepID=UPI000A6FC4F1|nr:PilC/PilY family type IV pilus protein [Ramlibacter tataouinensis]